MTPPVSSPAIKVVKSVREQVSPEEWQTRVDLAACYRLTALYGYTEMIANHISCRVPGTTDHFLINPYGMLYEEIDASCLIKVDCNGNTLFNASDYHVNAAGFVIHSAIHMARKDMDCVAHTHTPAGMAVSAMECGLLPLAQTSMRFLHIAYHDFEGIAVGDESPSQTFTAESTGATPVTITSVEVLGADEFDFQIKGQDCYEEELSPGQTCEVEVAFAPESIGDKDADLHIGSDDGDSPAMSELDGEGLADAGIAVDRIAHEREEIRNERRADAELFAEFALGR